MRTQARLVIVGAGIVGCATAYHLAELGWRDVLVLDQGDFPETGGSTSHAPGGVFQTNASRMLAQCAKQTVALLTSLDLDGQPCMLQVGGLELATTEDRRRDQKRRLGLARAWGIPAELVGPAEIARLSPLVDTRKVLGGFWTPTDGIAKPLRATAAMARAAEAAGISFQPRTTVTGIEVARGRVQAVQTDRGRIACEHVLVCCGIWGPRLGRMVGVPIPLMPCEHQYAWTNPIAELAGETEEARHVLLRHQDRAMYFRQHQDGYGIGNYRHTPRLVEADAIRAYGATPVMPSIVEFTPEDFVAAEQATAEILPAVHRAGIRSAFNGMFSFTPDGMPVMGESLAVRGFWAAEAVWVTHAGGVGKAIAEWIATGEPGIDCHEADINRFHPHMTTPAYVRRRAWQQYVEVYDVIHPAQQMEAPRGLRRSPFHSAQVAAEAVFHDAAGYERPQWYESNRALLEGRNFPVRDAWAARYWSPIQGAEHERVRSACGLFDLTAFTKVELRGRGACRLLQRLCANDIDRPVGKVVYTAMLNGRGGIEADLTVARLATDRFLVLTGGAVGMHDLAWIRRHAPEDGSVVIEDVSSRLCAVGLWGPQARRILAALTESDVGHDAFPYYSWKELVIGYVPALALRLSYVGELGFEIYTATEFGAALWEQLLEAGRPHGLVPCGAGAMDSLRLEKGYRLWGADILPDTTPLEAGLMGAVRLGKGEFIGRAALLDRRQEPLTRKLCALTLDDPGAICLGKEPILEGERVLGYVTSANMGYTLGRPIAYGYLPPAKAAPGTRVAIEYLGERLPATVAAEPLFDPKGERLRA
jgi:glycine cleavage system T protein